MIIPINLFFSNAYLVNGDRPILVDTGSPGEIRALQSALSRHGVGLSGLALILHTHGHSDHAGNSAELRRLSGAPVAVHHADAVMLRQGHGGPLLAEDVRRAFAAEVEFAAVAAMRDA
jgi:glyoxylase-like metal-dependent hydrolase (beta-lactamase superfamily II)